MKRLYETIDDTTFFTNYGIFKTIYSLNAFTWLGEDESEMIDLEYYFNHSNEKWISPLFEKLYGMNPSTTLTALANIIINKYGDKWNRLYDAFITTTYDPIENYSMTEGSNANTDINVNSKIYGFNSETGVNASDTNTNGSKLTNTAELTRSGNIGVTTSQQMLESELNLRQWNFIDQMMADVDSILCLKVY